MSVSASSRMVWSKFRIRLDAPTRNRIFIRRLRGSTPQSSTSNESVSPNQMRVVVHLRRVSRADLEHGRIQARRNRMRPVKRFDGPPGRRRFGGKNVPRLEGVEIARAEVERALHMTLDAAAGHASQRHEIDRQVDVRPIQRWQLGGVRMKSISCQSDQGSRSVPR